jgi:hypothetical protein
LQESPCIEEVFVFSAAAASASPGLVCAQNAHTSFAGLADELLGRPPLGRIELVDDVTVGVERHRGRVAGLRRDVDHGPHFGEEQRYERVAEVVWSRQAKPDLHRTELRTLADYVRLYGKRGLEFRPGSRWSYSNYGFILLGRVIENVTGQSYYDYVQQHIYKPAGMSRSG